MIDVISELIINLAFMSLLYPVWGSKLCTLLNHAMTKLSIYKKVANWGKLYLLRISQNFPGINLGLTINCSRVRGVMLLSVGKCWPSLTCPGGTRASTCAWPTMACCRQPTRPRMLKFDVRVHINRNFSKRNDNYNYYYYFVTSLLSIVHSSVKHVITSYAIAFIIRNHFLINLYSIQQLNKIVCYNFKLTTFQKIKWNYIRYRIVLHQKNLFLFFCLSVCSGNFWNGWTDFDVTLTDR